MAETMVAISAQNNSSQETVKSIQEGTMKLVSESEVAKQHIVFIEQRMDMLAEQQSKASIPPIHPDPEGQTPELEEVKSSKDSSPVLECESKDSLIMEEAQSINNNGSVSNNSDSASKSTGCLLYTSPSPRDISGSRMPSSA